MAHWVNEPYGPRKGLLEAVNSALKPPSASHKPPHTHTIIIAYTYLDLMRVFLKIHDRSKDKTY
jgi:hypothetical protein